MDWLKSVHFYRKVPRDLTEATLAGGTISLISSIVMAYLFFTNFASFLQVDNITSVQLDEGQESKIQINFNVTLHNLPCRFASLDIVDIMGTHLQNVSANIHKTRVDATGSFVARASSDPTEPKYADARNPAAGLDVPKVSPDLGEAEFKVAVKDHQLVMVNFYAPWCPWSRRLQPVWEEAYANVKQKPFADKVLMAKADCTGAGADLCRTQHVHAFPTVRVYRRHREMSHESYVGDRTHDAMESFIEENVHDMDASEAEAEGSSEVAAGPGEGCTVRGVVLVNRVPGNFHLSAHSKSHSFQPGKLNMSHTVGYMNFGRSLSPSILRVLAKTEAHTGFNVLADTLHVAKGHNTTLEHYLKVVRTSYVITGRRSVIDTYQYTANSNNYQDGDSLPAAVFAYDVSPMQVLVQQKSKTFAAFLTQICAIIGGVFTVTGLLDGLLYHGHGAIKRKLELGKMI